VVFPGDPEDPSHARWRRAGGGRRIAVVAEGDCIISHTDIWGQRPVAERSIINCQNYSANPRGLSKFFGGSMDFWIAILLSATFCHLLIL